MTTIQKGPYNIGYVSGVHGLKGELKIVARLEAGEKILSKGAQVFFDFKDGDPESFTILASRRGKNCFLLLINGVSDRNSALRFRGAQVLARLPETDSDSLYLADLIGLRVLNLRNNTSLGLVTGFLNVPEGEVWVIRTGEGEEIYFPAEPEFILEISTENKTIIVDPPPGLLELFGLE